MITVDRYIWVSSNRVRKKRKPTVTEDEAKRAILHFLNCMFTDMDQAAALMSDDFVWENFLPGHVPFGGRYDGREGLETYVAQLAENWVLGTVDISEVIVDANGRRLAAIGVERDGRSLSTGKSIDMAFVWLFRLNDDGKFSYVREYNDTYPMGQIF